MRVPLSWIRDFAPVPGDARAVADMLDSLGLVVEEIVEVGGGLGGVVVARVEEIGAIAGADRIRRVVVDAGSGPVEVVCGAWNFSAGDLVPLAPVGAVLPGDFEVSRRKMKGVVSNGMLCSPRELRLSEDSEGILILDASNSAKAEPGMPLMEALGIEQDFVFDLAVEANRPDAWCVAGVARDLAAHCKVPFSLTEPSHSVTVATTVGDLASVEVLDKDLCPRFTARVLQGIAVAPSPPWIQRRLTMAGMRPINNVVDASNYVMLELGQPTHPYDRSSLPGAALRVRAARVGEAVVTLDGVERIMGQRNVGGGDDQRDCLICDGEDRPVGIAGVMGGVSSEISDATTDVLLEAAYFTPMAVARTSKRLGLRTEASARFERGCDPHGIDRAAMRLIDILAMSSGDTFTQAAGTLDVRGEVPGPVRLSVRTERVNAVLGTELAADDIEGLLRPIGFATEAGRGGVLDVEVPTFRPDTEREIDVIEEVARHFGYGRIKRRRPHPPQVGSLTSYQRSRREVRAVVAGLGAHEAWTTSLLRPDDHQLVGMSGGVKVANPLTPDEAVLRQSLLPGMLRALAFNEARRQGDVRLFEIGHVFPPPDEARVRRSLERSLDSVIDEREHLGILLGAAGDDARSAAEAWYVLADALAVVGVDLLSEGPPDRTVRGGTWDALHPTRRVQLVDRDQGNIGVAGEIDRRVLEAFGVDGAIRRVGWVELDLGTLLTTVRRAPGSAKAVSRFPSSDIDLALVVDEAVSAAAVRVTLADAGGLLLESVRLFDVYRGTAVPSGARSLAFRLRFCALDHTLTDQELSGLRQSCIDAAASAHSAVLRS